MILRVKGIGHPYQPGFKATCSQHAVTDQVVMMGFDEDR